MLVHMLLAEPALARALNSAMNRKVMARIVFMVTSIEVEGWTNLPCADHWAVLHPLTMRINVILAGNAQRRSPLEWASALKQKHAPSAKSEI